ncbi:cytochrome c [Bradyrhizobium sp.]|uniref:cytochrome c n=1 Tax=Bradyrhizobium sp. TaxID=376 RepID=UPI003C743C3A
MKISRTALIHTWLAVAIIIVAVLFVRLRHANGAALPLDSVSAGHRLAAAWCKDCHAIEAAAAGARGSPPDFVAIANLPSTTALSLKVFLRTSHRNMPNLIIAPEQADDLVNYILSLKRD